MVTRLLVNILRINYKRIGHCYINFIKMFSIFFLKEYESKLL